MLEWKTIHLENKNFIGMHIMLPKQQIFIITSTKCLLVGEMFNIEKLSPTSSVFVMEKSNSFNALLESRVLMMNQYAISSGYSKKMKGREILLYK